MTTAENGDQWVPAFPVHDLERKRKLKLETDAGDVVLVWHDDCPRALANICIHRERELVNGTVFDGRLVCPGHQWAFDLETGYCKERERSQPVYDTRVENGIVHVNLTPRDVASARPRS